MWDRRIVLQYIRTQWYDNLSLIDAILKLNHTTLLSLTEASRASVIKHLNTEFMAKEKDKYIFCFNRLQKILRKGHVPPAVTYFGFVHDKTLCVVEMLNKYVNRSKPWRESNHEKKFLSSKSISKLNKTSSYNCILYYIRLA